MLLFEQVGEHLRKGCDRIVDLGADLTQPSRRRRTTGGLEGGCGVGIGVEMDVPLLEPRDQACDILEVETRDRLGCEEPILDPRVDMAGELCEVGFHLRQLIGLELVIGGHNTSSRDGRARLVP